MKIDSMTPEQKRIAIAEACGWKCLPRLLHNGQWKDIPSWVQRRFYDGKPEDYCMGGQMIGAMPPDYLNDLNAMHEAEKILKDTGQYTGLSLYITSLGGGIEDQACLEDYWQCCHATAAQRADAFLLTI
jgi:hypothetical protein